MEHDGFYPTGNGFLLCGAVTVNNRSVRVDGRDPSELLRVRKDDLRFEDCGGGQREYSRVLITVEFLE